MVDPILEIEGLTTRFFTGEGQINAVSDVDLTIDPGETVGVVGESGSGKSVTALSIMDLVEDPGQITAGSVRYRNPEFAASIADRHPDAVDGDYVDLLAVPKQVRRSLRGTSFSMIFQDPESSFNPSITVGEQIAEAVEVQRRATTRPRSVSARSTRPEYRFSDFLLSTVFPSRGYVSESSKQEAISLLEQVGIPDPKERAGQYPHEFSGGMLQRAMIAQALAGEPDVLIADEPTTALDVTIQAQVLELLNDLQAEFGMSILLITHDLGVVARMCERVGVMYAGQIVERGTVSDIFETPAHPYTEGLIGSIPDIDTPGGDRLQPISGNVPSLLDSEMGTRCAFADRCPKAMQRCLDEPSELDAPGSQSHTAQCYLVTDGYAEEEALPAGYFESSGGDS